MRRLVVKMSGEAIADPDGEEVVDGSRLDSFAAQVAAAKAEAGPALQVAIVVGGGNIARGKSLKGISNRTRADHMGMLATIINGLALQDALERHGLVARVLTGLEVPKVAEPHIYGRAIKHLEAGRVVVFAGGTGDPYLTTDTAAALRASEIDADALLLAKYQTRGVYTSDPNTDHAARLFKTMPYNEVLTRDLEVMDWTALGQCKEQEIPIYVFDMHGENAVMDALLERHHEMAQAGTYIRADAAVVMHEG